MLPTKEYFADFCVVGGGMAGLFAAVACAREGARVVLMQDRPVLGGNASSEIRMWVCGARGKNVTETGLLEELFMTNLRKNPYKRYPMFDALLWEMAKKEKNITLLMNCSCLDAEMTPEKQIKSVTGWQTTTQSFCKVNASLFADCSGDSILAPLTGASYRIGRESSEEFGENVQAIAEDRKTMGNSCLIQARMTDHPVKYIAPDFAKKLTHDEVARRRPVLFSSSENFWYLELGGDRDTISDAETIRDELVALSYGMWDFIKNSGEFPEAENMQLEFMGFLPGKRESRRMMGKVLINQLDISSGRMYEDTVAYGGWPLDDHDPGGFYKTGEFCHSIPTPAPYAIPYRALYSENIDNLFFAGRNISMTHAAMSSTRVMATCALCGQAIGTAAALCTKYKTQPHGIYTDHLSELQKRLLWNDCMLPGHPRMPEALSAGAKKTLNGKPSETLSALFDGNDRENVFVCDKKDRITLTFDKPSEVHEIRIIFDSDLCRTTLPGSECERFHMTRCNELPDSPVMTLPTTLCSEYTLTAVLSDGSTAEIRHETDNIYRLVKIPFEAKGVCSVSLVMNDCHGGEQMRAFSLDIR